MPEIHFILYIITKNVTSHALPEDHVPVALFLGLNFRNDKARHETCFHLLRNREKMSRDIEILISVYGAWTLAKTTFSPKACFAELLNKQLANDVDHLSKNPRTSALSAFHSPLFPKAFIDLQKFRQYSTQMTQIEQIIADLRKLRFYNTHVFQVT